MNEARFLFGDNEHRAYQINDTSVLIVRRMHNDGDFEDIIENSATTEAFVRAAAVFIDSSKDVDYRIVTQVVRNDTDWQEGRREVPDSDGEYWMLSHTPLVQIVPAMAEHYDDDVVFDCFCQINEFKLLLTENEESESLEEDIDRRLAAVADSDEQMYEDLGLHRGLGYDYDDVGVDGT